MFTRLLLLITIASTAVVTGISNVQAAPENQEGFDHFNTGFPLSGQHVNAACDACHLKGIFKGTPKNCNGCHNGQIAPGKHAKHIVSDETCDNCHTTFSWDAATVDHSSVIGSCSTCHNGSRAPGKHSKHMLTSAECDSCHGTVSWVPASFNHDNVTGRCESCHNGRDATGKHATHLNTTQDCGECHNTVSFTGASFNHANITGRCDACHNGRDATGKHASHLSTTQDCGDCHNTNNWATAGFNHDNIGGSRCDSCHNGQGATGKHPQHVMTTDDCGTCHMTTAWVPANFDHSTVVGTCSSCHLSLKANNHFITSRECNSCHNTTSWPIISFVHSSSNYPGDHPPSVECIHCHTANNEIITVPFITYGFDCAGCHADDWPGGDKHKHTVGATVVNYTLAELSNCAGSCHKEAEFIAQHHSITNGRGIQ